MINSQHVGSHNTSIAQNFFRGPIILFCKSNKINRDNKKTKATITDADIGPDNQ